MALVIWTLGHSTRPMETFLTLLRAHGIRQVIDVRAFPSSARHPQFHGSALTTSLPEAGLIYRHLPLLGGRRKSRPDSINLGWRNSSFRGYADYMQTEPFQRGLSELMDYADGRTTAIMCAEALPWRCHRTLIADDLVSHGWEVRHIMTATTVHLHRLTAFATRENGRLVYRRPVTESGPTLF